MVLISAVPAAVDYAFGCEAAQSTARCHSPHRDCRVHLHRPVRFHLMDGRGVTDTIHYRHRHAGRAGKRYGWPRHFVVGRRGTPASQASGQRRRSVPSADAAPARWPHKHADADGAGTISGAPDAWNSADKSANITLSNNDKTATLSAAVTSGVRSTKKYLNGTETNKFYVEFFLTNAISRFFLSGRHKRSIGRIKYISRIDIPVRQQQRQYS